MNAFAALAAVLTVVAAGVWLINESTPDIDPIGREAVVTFALMAPQQESASWVLSMQAKLRDGQLIVVQSNERVPPTVGSTILVHEVQARFRPKRYLWSGEVKPPA